MLAQGPVVGWWVGNSLRHPIFDLQICNTKNEIHQVKNGVRELADEWWASMLPKAGKLWTSVQTCWASWTLVHSGSRVNLWLDFQRVVVGIFGLTTFLFAKRWLGVTIWIQCFHVKIALILFTKLFSPKS